MGEGGTRGEEEKVRSSALFGVSQRRPTYFICLYSTWTEITVVAPEMTRLLSDLRLAGSKAAREKKVVRRVECPLQ